METMLFGFQIILNKIFEDTTPKLAMISSTAHDFKNMSLLIEIGLYSTF